MIRFVLTAAFALFLSTAAQAAERYHFDKSHTRIIFFISHLGFSNMMGQFHDYEGFFTFDEKHPERSTVEVTINPASVDADHDGLNEHLRGKDFFNVKEFPEMKFVSTRVKKTGPRTGKLLGKLTMLGVTRPVVLDVTFNKGGYHPYTKKYVAGFTAQAVLKRSDFGMDYGIPDVGDAVQIHIEAEGEQVEAKRR